MQSLLLALGLLFLPGVWMNAPMPDGFVTAYRQDAQAGRIEERIARGETLDDWSRMVTLIRLNGAMPAEAFSESFAMALRRNCPGAVVAPRGAARLGGLDAVAGRIDCPLNPETGKPETFFYRVVATDGALLMAQVAFRHVPDATETGWATVQLDAVVLCRSGSPDLRCSES